MLSAAIRLYRRYKVVKMGVKLLILFHHTARPKARSACTLADCSGTGLAEAQALGWRALPGILSRINACGYNTSMGTRHRRPKCADSDGISVAGEFCPLPPLAPKSLVQWGQDICPTTGIADNPCSPMGVCMSGPPAPGRPCDVMSSIGDYESWTGCPKGHNRIMPDHPTCPDRW